MYYCVGLILPYLSLYSFNFYFSPIFPLILVLSSHSQLSILFTVSLSPSFPFAPSIPCLNHLTIHHTSLAQTSINIILTKFQLFISLNFSKFKKKHCSTDPQFSENISFLYFQLLRSSISGINQLTRPSKLENLSGTCSEKKCRCFPLWSMTYCCVGSFTQYTSLSPFKLLILSHHLFPSNSFFLPILCFIHCFSLSLQLPIML